MSLAGISSIVPLKYEPQLEHRPRIFTNIVPDACTFAFLNEIQHGRRVCKKKCCCTKLFQSYDDKTK